MSDIASYFDRYDRKSPLREAFLQSGDIAEWLSDSSLEKVTADNYPKLYKAVQAECEFRKTEVPDFYIDKSGDCRLAYARRDAYAVFVEPAAYEVFDEKELRALAAHEIKHLYQGLDCTDNETRQNELDADRAAVESTDYTTIQSYVHKAASLMIDRMVPKPLQSLAHKFHETFPNFASEYFFVRIDSEHPSPATRMRAMRNQEKSLQNSHEIGGLIHLNLDR